ncbi:MAG: 23S rRNA (guanosine(2251)-2'-O)-methyltransferase RlmB [Bdellovibrionaceae bacterium]|nr:23S rRNA (guanosine(2251)-2'-O)-methyltransferase RlmB [Pseudobdellovibrionaceae bacterium]
MKSRIRKQGKSRNKNNKQNRWVVGLHSSQQVVEVRPQSIVKALIKKGSEGEEFVPFLKEYQVDIRWVNDQELLKYARSHQGIALEVSESPEVDWDSVYEKEKSIVLILDGIVDPHNLGAIMRTAWLMGCDAVVTTQHRSVGLTPSVTKVASGAAEHIPLVIESQLPQLLKDLKENGYWVLGLAHSEKNNLWEQELANKVAWVIGSEDKGLRKTVSNECDQLIRIPQQVSTASYNASVATAIALSETQRQHSLL